MNSQIDRAARRPRRRPPLPLAAAGASLLLAGLAAVALAHPVARSGDAVEARELHTAIVGISRLAQRRLTPSAATLSRELPAEADRVGELRQPSSTVEAELGVALDEMRQMDSLVVDPHYLPALLAVGRAYTAASGRDPLTRTTVSPEYAGLARELADHAGRLGSSADRAARLSAGLRRLSRALARARRRAHLLRRRLERGDAREARARR